MVRRDGCRNGYPGLDGYALRVIQYRAARLAGRGAFAGLDREDLEQELAADLVARLPGFDPARGALSTFVARVVSHRISALLESRCAEKRRRGRNAASLNDEVDAGGGARAERWQTLDMDAQRRMSGAADGNSQGVCDLRMDVRAAIDGLSPEERRLCAWLLHHSVTEVARIVRLPRSTLQHHLRGIRARFEQAGLDAYLPGRWALSREPR